MSTNRSLCTCIFNCIRENPLHLPQRSESVKRVHFAHSFHRKIEAPPLSERTRSIFDTVTSSTPCFVRAGFALKPSVVMPVTRYCNVFSAGVKSMLMNISLAVSIDNA